MFYSFDLTIPRLTTEADPATAVAEMNFGRIHRVEVQFPRGCYGLVHVRVLHALHPLWPSNPDGDLAGDGFVIVWDDEFDFVQEPPFLTLQGWNDDDTYPHVITFRFGIDQLRGAGFVPAPAEPIPPGAVELEV